jgi:hypothetical protein
MCPVACIERVYRTLTSKNKVIRRRKIERDIRANFSRSSDELQPRTPTLAMSTGIVTSYRHSPSTNDGGNK